MCGSHAVVCGLEVEGLQSTEVFRSLCLELTLTRLDDFHTWSIPFDVVLGHFGYGLMVSRQKFDQGMYCSQV